MAKDTSRSVSEQGIYDGLHEKWMQTDPEYIAEEMALDAAETFARIMQMRGLTQAEFARTLGVSRGYLSRFFDAPPNMTLKTLATIGLALDAVPRLTFPAIFDATTHSEAVEPTMSARRHLKFVSAASDNEPNESRFPYYQESPTWQFLMSSDNTWQTSSASWPKAYEHTRGIKEPILPGTSTSTAPATELSAAC